MIYVTKFNHQLVLLNSDLIEQIEETPDTVITMKNGKKLVVLESMKEIYSRTMEEKQLSRLTNYIKD
ncbi:MAG: flagellar FlbD family protein [Vallitaleaceae bacterium]|nr:flagellar FlbD family protein [Vallitaleaceae bacterium]